MVLAARVVLAAPVHPARPRVVAVSVALSVPLQALLVPLPVLQVLLVPLVLARAKLAPASLPVP